MGRLLIKHLQSKGVRSLTVVNRSLPRAEALAEEFPSVNMRLAPMSTLLQEVEVADVVFCASGAGEVLLHAVEIKRMAERYRMVVDISVPRNVDPAVGEADRAELYNVDDLREVVASNLESRAAAVAEAEALIADGVDKFIRRKASHGAESEIRNLRARAGSIQETQLAKYLAKLDNKGVGLSEEQAVVVRQLTHSVVAQLLHESTVGLRKRSVLHFDGITTSMVAGRPEPPSHWDVTGH